MNKLTFRAASFLVSILMMISCLTACETSGNDEETTSAGISAINLFFQSDSIELSIGEISSKMHITVTSTEEFSRDDIEFISDNDGVARINYEETAFTKFIYFTVEGVGEGETDIHFKSADGNVKSDKIHVRVHEARNSDTVTTADDTTAAAVSSAEETEAPDTSVSKETQSYTQPTEITVSESISAPIPNGTTVYITPSGTKYHYSMSCAGKNAIETSLSEAMATREPCKKCAGVSDSAVQNVTEAAVSESYDNSEAIYNGTTVYITPTGKKYHLLASCASKNAIPTTLESAAQTYEPCKKCAQ